MDEDDWLDALGEVARRRRDAEAGASEEAVTDAQLAAALAAAEAGLAEVESAEVVSLWPRAVLAVAMAAAVLAMLWVPSAPVLPTYELEVRTQGASTFRGEQAPLQLAPATTFEISLRPATRHDVELAVQAVLVAGDRHQALEPTVTVSPGGAVRLSAQVPALPGEEGVLRVRLSPEGQLPAPDAPATEPTVELTWPYVRSR